MIANDYETGVVWDTDSAEWYASLSSAQYPYAEDDYVGHYKTFSEAACALLEAMSKALQKEVEAAQTEFEKREIRLLIQRSRFDEICQTKEGSRSRRRRRDL